MLSASLLTDSVWQRQRMTRGTPALSKYCACSKVVLIWETLFNHSSWLLSGCFFFISLTSGALNGSFQLFSFLCFFSSAAHTSLFNRLILKPVPFSLPVPGPLPLLVLPIHFQDYGCSRGCVFIPWMCVPIPQPQPCSWGAVRKLLMLHVPLRPGQDQPE